MPLIDISDYLKGFLNYLKKREGHKSYDSAIRSRLATKEMKESEPFWDEEKKVDEEA